jgi:hypothetical protein
MQGEKPENCSEGKIIFYSGFRLGKPGKNLEEKEYIQNG